MPIGEPNQPRKRSEDWRGEAGSASKSWKAGGKQDKVIGRNGGWKGRILDYENNRWLFMIGEANLRNTPSGSPYISITE